MVIMGLQFWDPLHKLLEEMVERGMIDRVDLDHLTFTDSPDEAMTVIQEMAVRSFGLKLARPRHRWWLGERPHR